MLSSFTASSEPEVRSSATYTLMRRHALQDMSHKSHVTRHTSHVTRHTLPKLPLPMQAPFLNVGAPPPPPLLQYSSSTVGGGT